MFQDAVYEAQQRGADYVCYRDLGGAVKFVRVPSLDVIATCSSLGFQLTAAGIAVSGKSLLDYNTGEFLCGTVAQMIDEVA